MSRKIGFDVFFSYRFIFGIVCLRGQGRAGKTQRHQENQQEQFA